MQRTHKFSPASLESMIATIGRDLARSFSRVLDAIPGAPHRPQWLARSLGVNIVLTSRILRVAEQRDPMAVAHMIPGPEPLRRLLRAAERKKVDPVLIADARAAVDRFQNLIDVQAGDRSALDAIISGWLPDAREKVELIAKQSVFRGISQLLGTASNLEHHTVIVYPSATKLDRADQFWLAATRGLRRIRPGLVAKYETIHSTGPMLTVSGEPVDGLHGLLLEQFCSEPLPQLAVSHHGDRMQYTLSGESVGVQSAVNLVHATYLPARKALHRPPSDSPRKATMAVGTTTPTRAIILDVLLHDDIYPGQQPLLYLYRAMPYGSANPDDPSRDVDRLDVIESIQSLGRGIAKFRAAENPEHLDMLQFVCEQRQWDGSKLRGFRCRIAYPIYSSEIVIAFELPVMVPEVVHG